MKLQEQVITEDESKFSLMSKEEAIHEAIQTFCPMAEKFTPDELDMSTYEWCVRNAFAAGMIYAQSKANKQRASELDAVFKFFHDLSAAASEQLSDVDDFYLLIAEQKDYWDIYRSHDLNVEKAIKAPNLLDSVIDECCTTDCIHYRQGNCPYSVNKKHQCPTIESHLGCDEE